ncbi:MbeD/MobD family mobilization/exclusion protein [Enterobacter hormaechei]|uniref:MbeD/MobD family mobilization/exclusion protein n=1 Tax=Enterobacter hormaechei TaxID=158836 RepID=UPI003D114D7F
MLTAFAQRHQDYSQRLDEWERAFAEWQKRSGLMQREHAALNERVTRWSQQVANLSRPLQRWSQACSGDEKQARAGRLPSITPALLRQLAGMVNNLNQISRKVNAGGAGHDRVQIVSALMAIDSGL